MMEGAVRIFKPFALVDAAGVLRFDDLDTDLGTLDVRKTSLGGVKTSLGGSYGGIGVALRLERAPKAALRFGTADNTRAGTEGM